MGARDVRGMSPHHRAVQEAVAAHVRALGTKRGLAVAAQRIGMGERAARHAHEGTEFAADAGRAARADAARLTLLREQIAQLQAEASSIGDRAHAAISARCV